MQAGLSGSLEDTDMACNDDGGWSTWRVPRVSFYRMRKGIRVTSPIFRACSIIDLDRSKIVQLN